MLLVLMNPVVSEGGGPCASVVAVAHTYEARIRVNGKVSKVTVQASDAGQAKKLVEMQFSGATVLSVKKLTKQSIS